MLLYDIPGRSAVPIEPTRSARWRRIRTSSESRTPKPTCTAAPKSWPTPLVWAAARWTTSSRVAALPLWAWLLTVAAMSFGAWRRCHSGWPGPAGLRRAGVRRGRGRATGVGAVATSTWRPGYQQCFAPGASACTQLTTSSVSRRRRLKNVFAIAVGMGYSLGIGENTRALVIARALREMRGFVFDVATGKLNEVTP